MKISKSDYPGLVALMQSAYPTYKGRKFFVEQYDHEFETHSYWDGGTKDYYVFVRADGKQMAVSGADAPWVQYEQNRKAKLVRGLACVRHTIFCGKDCGLTLMLCSDDMPKMIEMKP